MVWNAGLEQGFIGKQEDIPTDLDKKMTTVTCTEECVLHCRIDPNCKHVIVNPSLVVVSGVDETVPDNCWLIYTEY